MAKRRLGTGYGLDMPSYCPSPRLYLRSRFARDTADRRILPSPNNFPRIVCIKFGFQAHLELLTIHSAGSTNREVRDDKI
jgi:hypothetical protein